MADLNHACGIDELLSAYLDGELRPGELEVVVERLETCLDCIAEFHSLREARTAVRLLETLQVPDGVIEIAHYGEDLSAYLDGELDTREHRIIGTHLATCTECRRELQDLDLARTAVRALPGVELPDFVHLDMDELSVRRRGRAAGLIAAIAGVAAIAVLVIGLAGRTDNAGSPIDLDTIAERHVARASLEAGFSIIPTGFTAAEDKP